MPPPSSAADYGPAPADDPRVYPGRLPASSFLFVEGQVHLFDATPLEDIDRRLENLGAPPLERRIAVLCSGSNANPAQIERKLGDIADTSLPVLLGWVAGLRPVYSAHVARYGAIPATLDVAGEGLAPIFIAFYTRQQLASTTRTEHGNYRLCEMPDIRCDLGPGTRLDRALAFLSTQGVLVLDSEEPGPSSEPLRLSDHNQETLVATLLARVADPSLPDAARYFLDPDRYRAAVKAAMADHHLRREHRVDHRPVDTPSFTTLL